MAKKILIPIDFSEHSIKAVEYACTLNDLVYHEFDLVHVFTDNTPSSVDSLTSQDQLDTQVGSARQNMQKIVSRLAETDSSRNINVFFKEGNLYQEINSLCTENQYDAIVMGTKGASGLNSFLARSNMYDVFVNTHVPVLAVPLHFNNRINKVGLLCNFKDGEIEVLQQANKLLGKDFELILVHVNIENEDIKKIDRKFKDFIDRVIEKTGMDNISYIIKNQAFFIQYKENAVISIESVLKDEQIDLLLVTKSKKSFFRKIVEENIVKKMALQVPIPIFFAKRPG